MLVSLYLNEYAKYISLDKGIVILKHEMKIVESFPKKKWSQLKSSMFSLVVTTQKETGTQLCNLFSSFLSWKSTVNCKQI